MKKISSIIVCLLFAPVFSQSAKDQSLEEGIRCYQTKDNEKAVLFLKDSIKTHPTGKAYYYLGNVYMNMNKYDEALNCYRKSFLMKYEINNSLFNSSCAYSLMNKTDQVNYFLIFNYLKGDRYSERISTDPDLANYRSSAAFQEYKELMANFNNEHPKNRNEVLKILNNEQRIILYDYYSPSPGTIKFESEGRFSEFLPGGYGGFSLGGNWSIDEKNKSLIIEHKGHVKYIPDNDPEFERYKNNPFDAKNNLYYIKIENNIEVIPFSNIRSNVYEVFSSEYTEGETMRKYNQIGRYKISAN